MIAIALGEPLSWREPALAARPRHRVPDLRRGPAAGLRAVARDDHVAAAPGGPGRAPRHRHRAGSAVPIDYDPMLGKLIVHGRGPRGGDRAASTARSPNTRSRASRRRCRSSARLVDDCRISAAGDFDVQWLDRRLADGPARSASERSATRTSLARRGRARRRAGAAPRAAPPRRGALALEARPRGGRRSAEAPRDAPLGVFFRTATESPSRSGARRAGAGCLLASPGTARRRADAVRGCPTAGSRCSSTTAGSSAAGRALERRRGPSHPPRRARARSRSRAIRCRDRAARGRRRGGRARRSAR